MANYILMRIGQALITLVFISLITFGLARLAGDPTPLIMPAESTEQDRTFFREQYGLDKSLPVQYFTFMGNVLQGDFGVSFRHRTPALEFVLRSLGPTLQLTGLAMCVSLVIGTGLGILAAVKRGGWIDRFVLFYASCGQAMPTFWFGLMAILLLAVHFPIFPTSGYGTPAHYFLPVLTLAFYASASITRLTRANMLESMTADFIHLQRVLGLSKVTIILKHALRNASLPIITYFGLQFGLLLGGAIITERVFAWPGLGQTIVNAVLSRDYPIIQASVLVTATLLILTNLVVDLICMVIDPRIRT
jgi:peptide/nickel transport system permease protein